MKRLVEIIGPAPSELPFEDLLLRLRKERDRVNAGLEAFRNGTAPTWKELRDKNWKEKRKAKAAKAKPKKKAAKKRATPKQTQEEMVRMLLADRVKSGALPLTEVAKSLNMTEEEAQKWLELPKKK